MALLIGSKGKRVKDLQSKLSKILNKAIAIDGRFGPATKRLVQQFQRNFGLTVDGVVGPITQKKINGMYSMLFVTNNDLMTFGKERFVVFVDAGHGGVDDTGEYVTPGKRAWHDSELMHRDGWYFEGYENRIVAEMLVDVLTKNDINSIRLYHPVKDTPLADRVDIVTSYLKRGYKGILISFHSNAISSKNTAMKLEITQGYSVWTSLDNTKSDEIATKHFLNVCNHFGEKWKYRDDRDDGDPDYEANFYMLRKTDLVQYQHKFGAILEEFGFHTSKKDAEFIVSHREDRVKCALKTIMECQKKF